jgi:DNA processing protein
LADNILANGGLLVAEMPPGVKIIPSMFAKRDRIQSGLSLAVFPIETNIDGGTMHAVNAAFKENRLVYVPDISISGYSDMDIPQLGGIKYLIEENKAIPYTKATYEDVLNSLTIKSDELLNPKVESKQGSLF